MASEVAARGLDIKDIKLVINLDLPTNIDSYVHRIGRTGRAGLKGVAISLISSNDAPLLNKLDKLLTANPKTPSFTLALLSTLNNQHHLHSYLATQATL